MPCSEKQHGAHPAQAIDAGANPGLMNASRRFWLADRQRAQAEYAMGVGSVHLLREARSRALSDPSRIPCTTSRSSASRHFMRRGFSGNDRRVRAKTRSSPKVLEKFPKPTTGLGQNIDSMLQSYRDTSPQRSAPSGVPGCKPEQQQQHPVRIEARCLDHASAII